VADQKKSGRRHDSIDEAAFREWLPLRRAESVDCFRICLSSDPVCGMRCRSVRICSTRNSNIVDAIVAMDADVISIETSRSKMELLDAFKTYAYPNEIGPGIHDIRSPRVPEVGEMTDLLKFARQRLADEQLWINPRLRS
jgi:5-methyltetrahydropteroyltriglutamate--homocysteine methyltransferase